MDVFFGIIGALFRGLWALIQIIFLEISSAIDTLRSRKLYRQTEEAKAARKADEAPLQASQETRDILYAAQHRPRIWNFLFTGYGKCAGCNNDLNRTDLDPNRPYFCSDKCKEDCAYIDTDTIAQAVHDAVYYELETKRQDAERELKWKLEAGSDEAQAERKRREAALSRRYARTIDLDSEDLPGGARKDRAWLEESAALYIREERAGRLKIQHDHERRVIAVQEQAARKLKEKMEYNRTHLDEMFVEYKRAAKERDDEAEKLRAEQERPWYTPLGPPPNAT